MRQLPFPPLVYRRGGVDHTTGRKSVRTSTEKTGARRKLAARGPHATLLGSTRMVQANSGTDHKLAIEPVTVEADYVLGAHANLVVCMLLAPPSRQSVEALGRAVEQVAAGRPHSVALVIVPRARRPALSSEAREAILSQWSQIERLLSVSALLFRATGFVGAIQRSLATTVLSMRRQTIPFKLTSNPLEVASWIASHDAQLEDAGSLAKAIRRFVAQHEP